VISQIRPRSLIPDIGAAGGPWASTGRPPSTYIHAENVLAGGLAYEDVYGAIGSPTRVCDLFGNVLVTGYHDDPNHVQVIESFQAMESPTIDLAIQGGPPATKNGQGIDQLMAQREHLILNYDLYTGYMDLDQSVFHHTGVRYHGPDMVSPISLARQWSPLLMDDDLVFSSFPECRNFMKDLEDAPFGTIDSLRIVVATETQGWRFGGTDLGNTRGGYFDNIRVAFMKFPLAVTPGLDSPEGVPTGAGPDVGLRASNRLQDSYPFNESIVPGDNAAFDTTTALMVNGLNIVVPATSPGVVAGDSLLARAKWTGDGITTGTRVDPVFRIDPGPGNYVIKGNRTSALVNKDPLHSFFNAYLGNNGTFGTPGGHGGTWNKDVWNSCRMDSAELNVYPIVGRGIGNPRTNWWMGTIHESDLKYNTLGIQHNVCFLVDPAGQNAMSNIACDGTTPAPYGAVSATTREGTKILPDGWFSPGTHIEYYVRSSYLENPSAADLSPNPDRVMPHVMGGFGDLDAERHANVDVLPDFWKSSRFGGAGLACLLMVDAADRRGADVAYRGAADSAGYGKNNGASSGWKRTGPTHSNPNIVSDYVLDNRGQYGLNFDHYDIQGAEAIEGGRPGCRLATNLGAIANKKAKYGPTPSMLANFYSSVLWLTQDLHRGTLHDGNSLQESADDVTLLDNFLLGATPPNPRSVWLSGENIAQEGAFLSPALGALLSGRFGATLFHANYKALTADPAKTSRLREVAPWSLIVDDIGIRNGGGISSDVLSVVPTTAGAAVAANYVDQNGTLYAASIYRPTGFGRDYRTLVEGFDLARLRGITNDPLGQATLELDNDNGRLGWLNDVLTSHFQICARRGPVIGVGDLPGMDGAALPGRLLQTAPNPAFAGQPIGITFTLAAERDVAVRFYSPAGREVARRQMHGRAGTNRMVWDGMLAGGVRAPAGVYFYRIEGLDEEAHGRRNRVVLLGP
jgi:hypothetical protein